MTSDNPFHQVWQFHEVFDCMRNRVPTLPDAATRKMRRDILEEEWQEYVRGEEQNDLVEIADALADIIYIAYGTGVAYGLPMDKIVSEVHASNMSKLDPVTGKPIYRSDGKVQKGANYVPPDIAGILMATTDASTERASLTVEDLVMRVAERRAA